MKDDERYVKVAGVEDLVKDTHTNALINTNNAALEAYKNAKKNKKRSDDIEQQVEDLAADIKQIKEMLMGLTRNG